MKIGFGSFIDKDLAPFKSMDEGYNCEEALALQGKCRQPYSLYHQIPLSTLSGKEFERIVKKAPLAGNVDNPEGGLDALLQVMLCDQVIGWRNSSRKVILLATDMDFHYALDGKLVGILQPNDGKCHLKYENKMTSAYYTDSKYYDYPSISQINYVAHQVLFVLRNS